MSDTWDDLASQAADALIRGDRDGASRFYERAAREADGAGAALDAGALYVMAAMHAPLDQERRDALRLRAQLVFHDAAEFDRASEVAFSRGQDARALSREDDARTLLAASIALAGLFLERAAYSAITSPAEALALEETAERVRAAAKALDLPSNPE
jgi:hypothetical protein